MNPNIQLAYWPQLTGNRLELGESLCERIDHGADSLARNAGPFQSDSAGIGRSSGCNCSSPVGEELCNLPWTMHSHLVMIYPLYTMKPEQPENRALVVKSLKHWMGMPQKLAGYSYTGAASISALLGEGDEAARYLNKLLDSKIPPNTLFISGCGDYQSTCDRPAEFPPQSGDWEGVPTPNESYGYNANDHSHKPVAHFIRLLAKSAADATTRLLSKRVPVDTLRAYDGVRKGGLSYGPGKKTDNVVLNWNEIRVSAKTLTGEELFRLRHLTLKPVKP